MDDSTKPLNSPVRLTSGVPGLDQILSGGLFSGGMYVVVGDPGSGKTILANQFCFHHLESGGRVVYITMLAETHARMFQYMQSLSFFNPAEIGLRIHYFSGFQWLRDGGLTALLTFLRGEIRALQPTLLILDGLAMVTNLAETSTALRTFFHVTLPVLRPGMLVGALFAFLSSFNEAVSHVLAEGPLPTIKTRASAIRVRMRGSTSVARKTAASSFGFHESCPQ